MACPAVPAGFYVWMGMRNVPFRCRMKLGEGCIHGKVIQHDKQKQGFGAKRNMLGISFPFAKLNLFCGICYYTYGSLRLYKLF
jgi:hypothetical protein